jgi:hypothetical protein
MVRHGGERGVAMAGAGALVARCGIPDGIAASAAAARLDPPTGLALRIDVAAMMNF